MKETEIGRKLMLRGLVDERFAAVVARLDGPAGYGLCFACINGNILRIVDTDFSQRIGELYHEIPIKEMEIIKSSSLVFNRFLKFRYHGQVYLLKDFGAAKEFLAIIQEEKDK